MTEPIRVVQWGTGNTGSVALQAILNSPALELAGVWARNPAYAAGALAGCATPAPVWNDIESVVAAAPDCVCYMATDRGRHQDVVAEFCRLLSAGINVVTTSYPMLVHPAGAGPDTQRRIEDACAAGGTSFLCTGVEPGFMADALVLHLTSLSREITAIRVQEAMNVGTYRGRRWRSGLGNDVATDAQHYVAGSIAQNWMGPMTMLAEGLGATLDRVYEVREIEPAGRDFTVPAGTYRANQVAALHFEVIGEVDGAPMFVIEHVYRLIDDIAPHWPQPADPGRRTTRIRIAGSPDIDVDVALGGAGLDATQQGVLATVMRAVNAIPILVAATPGMHSPLELPLITGRAAIERSMRRTNVGVG
ncbi:Gfo/Idh/MocA family oxidoreductase [Mycobacterium vicinigordonae]|uniref:Diacylglycerol kinase n=1 Tax=Mycobacterium vicinigordonae TaxID=1719132 RepID=A0A7D6E1A0_9MYCO|nr:Gfo/Idh/MocA family oxidoreductase [Mycobacterium vicinigordonae]QLL09787.1 diacylglycerol kinase [Mycobacterium vicinigordonae]